MYPTGVRPGSEYSFDWRSNILQRSTYAAHSQTRLAQLDPTLRLQEGARPTVTREYTALMREQTQRSANRVFRPRQLQLRQQHQRPLSVTSSAPTTTSATPTVLPTWIQPPPAQSPVHDESDGLYDSEGEIHAVLTDQASDTSSDESAGPSQPPAVTSQSAPRNDAVLCRNLAQYPDDFTSAVTTFINEVVNHWAQLDATTSLE